MARWALTGGPPRDGPRCLQLRTVWCQRPWSSWMPFVTASLRQIPSAAHCAIPKFSQTVTNAIPRNATSSSSSEQSGSKALRTAGVCITSWQAQPVTCVRQPPLHLHPLRIREFQAAAPHSLWKMSDQYVGGLQMEWVNLLCFDEAHHATGGHPYALIMSEFYTAPSLPRNKRPHVFGMTASPVNIRANAKINRVSDTIQHLEGTLDCTVPAPSSPLPLFLQLWLRPITVAILD